MRYFLDTEFHDRDDYTELISIGVVDADGLGFYAISSDFDYDAAAANPWLAEHVLPYLEEPDAPAPIPRAQIASDLADWCASRDDGRKHQAWAWNGAYDFYLLAKLYGRLINVPEHVPSAFFDLKQTARTLGNVTVPGDSIRPHHALFDAHHDRAAWEWLMDYERAQHAKRAERVRARLLGAVAATIKTADI